MFKLAIASLLVAATLAELPKPDFGLLSDEEIHYINNVAKTTWTAGRNFHPDDHAYVKSMLGASSIKESTDFTGQLPRKESSESLSIEGLPESFDAREKWPNCPSIQEIKDQGNCANAWAVGAASTMTDRFCIASQGKTNFQFSAQDLFDCCPGCGTSCEGGVPAYAWKHFELQGVVSGGPYSSEQGCKPYKFQPCKHQGGSGKLQPCNATRQFQPYCREHCLKGYHHSYYHDLHYASSAYYVHGEQEMMNELVTYGPIQTDMWTYTDFLQYKSGVYKYTSGEKKGYHSVKIIGYGVEKGTKYWLVANSWNTDWGDKGLFKIQRGTNECTIESYVVAGIPAV